MEKKNLGKERLVSVFVPAYNEEGSVSSLIDKIVRAFEDYGVRGEIVFINDGSADHTGEEAEKAAKKYPMMKVIHHRRNLGLTEAMQTGFAHVSGDVIIFLCSDLESDPEEDIPKLLGKIDEGYDMVVGWRQGRKDGKVPLSKIYNFVCRKLFGVTAHDMNWVKAFRREVMEDLVLRSDWHRFIYMLAASKGYRVTEVKTNFYPRKKGRSKYGFLRVPISFLDVIVLKFILVFRRKPMLFFGSVGALLFASGGFLGLYLVYLWMTIQTQKRPLLTLSVMLILSGIQFFVTGFLAELVVSQQDRFDKLEKTVSNVKTQMSKK